MRDQLLFAISVASLLVAGSRIATAGNNRVLPESEWPTFLYLDVPDKMKDCKSEGGQLTAQSGGSYMCTISPQDCGRKPGWQVIERDAVTTAFARIKTCHRK